MKLDVCKHICALLIFEYNYVCYLNINMSRFLVIGIQWSNMFIAGDAQYNIVGCVGFILLFSLLGTLLHFSLALYINAVFPGKYGVRKKPFYFLKVNYSIFQNTLSF